MNRKQWAMVRIGVFFGMLAFLWLLLLGAAAIPNEAIKKHMEQSAVSYKEREAFSFERGGRWNGISDNYADAILLNVSWNMGRGNPFFCSLDTWYYSGGELGENAGLYLAVTEEEEPDTDYTRYWHGTAMWVRLLHLVTDVEGIKWIGLLTAMALALMTVILLVRQKHSDIAIALLLSMGAVQMWDVRLSLEYEPAFVICFLLCPLYLWLEKKGDEYLTCLSVAGGVLIAFFDFLTTETMVILVPLILVIAVRTKEKRLGDYRNNMRVLAWCLMCWALAYGGTFLMKWMVTSLITGDNKFLLALSSAGERVGGTLPGETVDGLLRIPMSVAANLTVIFGGRSRVELPRVMAGLAAVFLILGSVFYLYYRRLNNQRGIRLLLFLGCVVFVRYMVLNNHSYLHEFFTYRALISPVLAVLVSMALSMEIPVISGGKRKKGGSRKRRAKKG